MKEDIKDKWREVSQARAEYAVILRPGSYDSSVCFYASKEDMEWALGNSWFSYTEAMPVKLLEKKIQVKII